MTLSHDEINALDEDGLRLEVAEVLGWKLYHFENPEAWTTSWYKVYKPGLELCLRENETARKCQLSEEKRQVFALCSNWPRDIAAAWGLVEEMRQTHRVDLIDQGNKWQCSADIKDGLPRYPVDIQHAGDFFANGPTAPIAICRAWLMWKAAR